MEKDGNQSVYEDKWCPILWTAIGVNHDGGWCVRFSVQYGRHRSLGLRNGILLNGLLGLAKGCVYVFVFDAPGMVEGFHEETCRLVVDSP